MIKFKHFKDEFGSGCVVNYHLHAKGKGIGDGISWTFIGTFAEFKMMNLMKRAVKQEHQNKSTMSTKLTWDTYK